MKYIIFPITSIDPNWQVKANNASVTASQKNGKDRDEYISGRNSVWAELKPTLELLSDGKCWYTEARDKVSYWQVDHYRPKSIYPWLAFDWRNMRLTGGIPNVSKLNHFPLIDESKRASITNTSIAHESPILLDPTELNDVKLITFTASGEATCAKPDDATATLRVCTTVRFTSINSEKLCAARREKWRTCERKLKALRKILEEKRQQQNIDAVGHLDELCRDLEDLYDDRAEFTATAWACAQELDATTIVTLAKQLAGRATADTASAI
ncbi:hypothetical protein PSFL_44430 [Pseudomonas sp. DD1]|uniref:hypothetical protein n=1 Tax=Pseudomonas sp. DD1 TaxID=879558 RepID=UPI0037C7FBC0